MKKKPKKDPKDMRHGYTTGSNATAATKAALMSLILQEEVKSVEITLPKGKVVPFQMENVSFSREEATVSVIKDAGDDPDATHKARICATVSWRSQSGIEIDGGIGVGRVTKTGLPVPVGEAAINPVPRKMIRETAEGILNECQIKKGVRAVISVPDGEEIAKKTLNGRLGIIGGISILGTSGIVTPFSTAAYRASVAQAIQVAVKGGCDHLLLSTGGRSEKFAVKLYPDEPEEAFIEMGDFVGFALKQCKAKKVKKITLVGMMGKFSKVAQGVMMVHSKRAPVDFDFLARIAEEAGAPSNLIEQVRGANTATEAGNIMTENGYPQFFERLCVLISESGLKEVGGGLEVESVLMTMKSELLGRETVQWSNQSK
jgi:cobalt-precorrin-5B (C1)-methyltransferase